MSVQLVAVKLTIQKRLFSSNEKQALSIKCRLSSYYFASKAEYVYHLL